MSSCREKYIQYIVGLTNVELGQQHCVFFITFNYTLESKVVHYNCSRECGTTNLGDSQLAF